MSLGWPSARLSTMTSMTPCRGRCFSAGDGSSHLSVIHEVRSELGLTWYHCPSHRVFHSLFFFRAAKQPLCGECAILYYAKSRHAIWLRQFDMPAIMSNSAQLYGDASAELDVLLSAIDTMRSGDDSTSRAIPAAPEDVLQNVLDEIPKDDTTYLSLGMMLIPHARLPNTYLLRYETFQGAPGYQTCSEDFALRDPFRCFESAENGDPVFRQARRWSCTLQATFNLPKELRWVLATVYNFCNEMLRQEVDEVTLWEMRSWLLHWYTVAECLLFHFGLTVQVPEIDWFARPGSSTPTGYHSNVMNRRRRTNRSLSSSSSDCGTVVCRRSDDLTLNIDATRSGGGGIGSRVAVTHEWLASQPQLPNLDETQVFDPTPRGYVSPRSRHLMASKTSTVAARAIASSSLNPSAAIFIPGREITQNPPCQGDSEGDRGSDTDEEVIFGSDDCESRSAISFRRAEAL